MCHVSLLIIISLQWRYLQISLSIIVILCKSHRTSLAHCWNLKQLLQSNNESWLITLGWDHAVEVDGGWEKLLMLVGIVSAHAESCPSLRLVIHSVTDSKPEVNRDTLSSPSSASVLLPFPSPEHSNSKQRDSYCGYLIGQFTSFTCWSLDVYCN